MGVFLPSPAPTHRHRSPLLAPNPDAQTPQLVNKLRTVHTTTSVGRSVRIPKSGTRDFPGSDITDFPDFVFFPPWMFNQNNVLTLKEQQTAQTTCQTPQPTQGCALNSEQRSFGAKSGKSEIWDFGLFSTWIILHPSSEPHLMAPVFSKIMKIVSNTHNML